MVGSTHLHDDVYPLMLRIFDLLYELDDVPMFEGF